MKRMESFTTLLLILILSGADQERPPFTNTYNPRLFSHTLKKEESELFSLLVNSAQDNYKELFELDAKLCAASRYLSINYAKRGSVPKRVETTALRPLLWAYGVYDFQFLPTAFVYTSSDSLKDPIKRYLEVLSKRGFFNCGAGTSELNDGRKIATIICSKRVVDAFDIPKIMTSGSYIKLNIRLREGFSDPIFYYSPPSGVVNKKRPAVHEKGEFSDTYQLDGGEGKYLIQIIAKGDKGVEPVFLIPIYVGMDINEIKKEMLMYVNLDDNTKDASEEEARDMLFKAINFERKKIHIKPLKLNPLLSQIAYEKSKMMAEKQLFGHDISERKTEDILKERGIKFGKMAENIGLNSSPRMAHMLFMSSPAHRANILGSEYSEVGIGIYKVGQEDPQWYITEIFILQTEF